MPRNDVPREARLDVVRTQVIDHQLARKRSVAVADAHRPEQNGVLGRAQDEASDAAPQQHERREAALVFGAHEGAPELDRRIEAFEQPVAVPEQRLRIQPAPAVARHDLVGETHAVGAGNRLGLGVPKNEVQVIGVEQVDVSSPARAFAGRAESRLTQPADLLQAPRNLRGARVAYEEVAALEQVLLRRQRLDLGLEERARNFRCERCLAGARRVQAQQFRGNDSGEHPSPCIVSAARAVHRLIHPCQSRRHLGRKARHAPLHDCERPVAYLFHRALSRPILPA